MIQLIQGDCLDKMADIEAGSVDMILCDLPYGTTACKWDSVIPFEPLWAHYERVIKKNGAIVLTASQPFTSKLVMSKPEWFRYQWVWHKVRVTGHLDAKRRPLKGHEDICVFSKTATPYFPQMRKGEKHIRGPRGKHNSASLVYGSFKDDSSRQYESDEYYPQSILSFRAEMKSIHPTQKPVALLEYLIRTYTNPGETVLDNTMGSGSTGVACLNTGRDFIGIEKDPEYFQIAQKRIAEANQQLKIV